LKIILELKQTADGSYTLYNSELNEHYHSIHGANTESLHVFIQNGLAYLLSNTTSNQINILEVGFGTGLNCYHTINYLVENKFKIKVFYHGLEPFPVDKKLINKLRNGVQQKLYSEIHHLKWNMDQTINDKIVIHKSPKMVQNLKLDKKYDLVFFDAFGPRVEDKLWDISVLKSIFHLMNSNGIFVTYCAKGQVRRDLEEIGFKVERLPGPPGKREMLRATKANNSTQKLEVGSME